MQAWPLLSIRDQGRDRCRDLVLPVCKVEYLNSLLPYKGLPTNFDWNTSNDDLVHELPIDRFVPPFHSRCGNPTPPLLREVLALGSGKSSPHTKVYRHTGR